MKKLNMSTKILATVLLTQGLIACSVENDMAAETFAINSKSSAVDLADAGEKLLTYQSLELADRLFEIALTKDKSNAKAQFYKDLTRPVMQLEGLLGRLEPNATIDSEQAIAALKDSPSLELTPYADFLRNSYKGKIRNLSQVQDLVVDVRNAFIDSSRSFKKTIGSSIDVQLDPILFSNKIGQNLKAKCKVELSGVDGEQVETFTCDREDVKNAKRYTVTSADKVVLQQVYAGMAIMLTPYTSYSLEDAEEAAQDFKSLGQEPDLQDVRAVADKYPSLLTLRKNHGIEFVKEAGLNLSAAMKWAVKYQNNFCSAAVQYSDSMAKALCFDSERAEELSVKADYIKFALLNPLVISPSVEGVKHEITLNSHNLLVNPVKDLKKTFLPVAIDVCGLPHFQDETFGGILNTGDLNRISKKCTHE